MDKFSRVTRHEVLEYHSRPRRGKLEVIPTKPCKSQYDLSLAYTPGVAEPCLEIHQNQAASSLYTARGNLVAVVTNGTAVLGLGNIGPYAAKPVMEGKAVLFKEFADIDVFDLEINESDPDKFVAIVKSLEPTFGGINLEDVKAPECFDIEKQLTEGMKIPVFHDDQHGTAIITTAAFLNALEISGHRVEDVRVVFSGAGAAAIACARMLLTVGVRRENVSLADRKGIVTKDRPELESNRAFFAQDGKKKTLKDALNGAHVFIGVSSKGLMTKEMLASMAPKAIVFALANPDPEIDYPDAMSVRKDLIMATGRSDYPNQVNNLLGFPYIFRGALDVGATCINEAMKLAAAKVLARVAHLPVPASVCRAYNQEHLEFGPNYIIPKPLDPRLLPIVAPAVALAAMDTCVATRPITDWVAYRKQLINMLRLRGRWDESFGDDFVCE